MKKILFIAALLVVSLSANAQLIVDSLGHVAVGYEGTSPLRSALSVNSNGTSQSTAYIYSDSGMEGLFISRSAVGMSGYNLGLHSRTSIMGSAVNCGIYSEMYSSSPSLASATACGVVGAVSGGTSGYCYGLAGQLNGSQNGAGVYGTSFSGDMGVNTGARYAGYFRGNVYTTGTLTASSLVCPSDYRLKTDIVTLVPGSLDALCRMNVVSYNYKQRDVLGCDGSKQPLYDVESSLLTHRHYGLIAQELQEIYPDLVLEGDDGYLSVNYVELIPLLIHSVQELSAQLEAAQQSNARRADGTTAATPETALSTSLGQNTPNPFTEATTIPLTVAEGVSSAVLYVYDLNGKQIAEYAVAGRGTIAITIEGGSLDAGMYLYSLIADGVVVDTKRMILTK